MSHLKGIFPIAHRKPGREGLWSPAECADHHLWDHQHHHHHPDYQGKLNSLTVAVYQSNHSSPPVTKENVSSKPHVLDMNIYF